MHDEHSWTCTDRIIGFLGPVSSVFTFAWIASHRDRLHTLVLGGHRLSVLVVWDSKGRELACRDDADEAAIQQLTRGSNHAAPAPSDARDRSGMRAESGPTNPPREENS